MDARYFLVEDVLLLLVMVTAENPPSQRNPDPEKGVACASRFRRLLLTAFEPVQSLRPRRFKSPH
jgi:hypothetical protein